jgi:diacylglycerol O-acyltransferase / wax synthase
MKQLTGQDASFVYQETPSTPMDGVGLGIYDPSTAPHEVTFERIQEHLASRLHMARMFRQKLVRVPLDLDHPYWIEDPDFDLEYHVRQIALPRPGNWDQLCTQTARLLGRPLDLTRPLWELYVIEGVDAVEGVPKGSFAMITKCHHAAIDGMSGVDMTNAIHDHSPEPRDDLGADTWQPESAPSPLDLLARAGVNASRRPMRVARVLGRTVPALRPLVSSIRRDRPQLPGLNVPRTRFSGAVTPHRVVDGRQFSLADMKQIKKNVDGATINDVVLAVVGGALRSYLSRKGELPDRPLIAMCPISVRTESEKSAGGNMVSAMFVSLSTDVDDPVERLKVITETTHRSKAFSEALPARSLLELSDHMPGALMGFAAQATSRLGLANRQAPIFNTTVTNMPGPQQPLYFAGAQLLQSYAFGMIIEGMALIHPVVSYCGDITICFASCREIMPDPRVYADDIERSFDALATALA